MMSAQSSSSIPPLPPSKKERAGPAFNLPATAYPDFLRAIEGSDLPKPVLIIKLFEAFKHRCTNECGVLRKGAVENKLSEVAYKEKKVWHVRPAEWVSHRAYI
jgi:chromatin assembly factor 1 subunit A